MKGTMPGTFMISWAVLVLALNIYLARSLLAAVSVSQARTNLNQLVAEVHGKDPELGIQLSNGTRQIAEPRLSRTVIVVSSLCGCDANQIQQSVRRLPKSIGFRLVVMAPKSEVVHKPQLASLRDFIISDPDGSIHSELNARYLPRVYIVGSDGTLQFVSKRQSNEWWELIDEGLGATTR